MLLVLGREDDAAAQAREIARRRRIVAGIDVAQQAGAERGAVGDPELAPSAGVSATKTATSSSATSCGARASIIPSRPPTRTSAPALPGTRSASSVASPGIAVAHPELGTGGREIRRRTRSSGPRATISLTAMTLAGGVSSRGSMLAGWVAQSRPAAEQHLDRPRVRARSRRPSPRSSRFRRRCRRNGRDRRSWRRRVRIPRGGRAASSSRRTPRGALRARRHPASARAAPAGSPAYRRRAAGRRCRHRG